MRRRILVALPNGLNTFLYGYLRGNIELSTRPAHGDGSNLVQSSTISELEPIRQLSEAVLKS
jgi:hypothetical protein